MSRRPAPVLAVVVALALSAGAPVASAEDREVAWAAVPSAERRHGEVRVLRRGDAVVVQTVLYSKVLRQVLGRIADKERRNWPEGAAGHDDAERYVAALAEVSRAPETRVAEGPDADRRRSLLIEFVRSRDEAFVAFGVPDVAESDGERLSVGDVRPILRLDPSRDYVERNMRLIVEDSLGLPADRAEATLREAGGP